MKYASNHIKNHSSESSPYAVKLDVFLANFPQSVIMVFSTRLASSSWTCTAIWYQFMMWSPWKRSLMPIWTSTCGTKPIRDASSHPGSNPLTPSRHLCSSTNGAKVRLPFYGGKGNCDLGHVWRSQEAFLLNLVIESSQASTTCRTCGRPERENAT